MGIFSWRNDIRELASRPHPPDTADTESSSQGEHGETRAADGNWSFLALTAKCRSGSRPVSDLRQQLHLSGLAGMVRARGQSTAPQHRLVGERAPWYPGGYRKAR